MIRRIYVDMDGVLADFDNHFINISGMHPQDYENRFGSDAFWDLIYSMENFFLNLPQFEHTQELWNYVTSKVRHVSILSAPSKRNTQLCVNEKIQWILKHIKMPNDHPPMYLFEKHKEIYAGPDALLIDDYSKKIDRWVSAGGVGLLFKDWEQAKEELDSLTYMTSNWSYK